MDSIIREVSRELLLLTTCFTKPASTWFTWAHSSSIPWGPHCSIWIIYQFPLCYFQNQQFRTRFLTFTTNKYIFQYLWEINLSNACYWRYDLINRVTARAGLSLPHSSLRHTINQIKLAINKTLADYVWSEYYSIRSFNKNREK